MSPKKTTKSQSHPKKVYVVSVDMGYGHQRATYPLQDLAVDGQIIHADNYEGMPKEDREIWLSSRQFYEFMSRFKKVPVVGNIAWSAFDWFQRIQPFYPHRDLSRPSLQLWSTMNMIQKKKWGKDFVEMLERDPRPLVTSFFIPAYMADYFNYSEDIYLIVCDADVSRAWAAYDPKKSRIKYLAPSKRVVERLQEYGVPKENIIYTGFPLPKENIGSEDSEILKSDLMHRIKRLDPLGTYCKKYNEVLTSTFGDELKNVQSGGRVTLTFAVGGAGAQRDIAMQIVKSLRGKLLLNQVKVNLIAGTHKSIAQFFHDHLERIGLHREVGVSIEIIYAEDKYTYFSEFNKVIRETDVLWTKPSELSFYTAFGLPIIMAPPLGSQEFFNRKWLRAIGAGIDQEDPRFTDEWFFDWLKSGWFAEAAMHGFLEAAKYGTYNIEKVVGHNETAVKVPDLVLQY